jgi:hypothetical protein
MGLKPWISVTGSRCNWSLRMCRRDTSISRKAKKLCGYSYNSWGDPRRVNRDEKGWNDSALVAAGKTVLDHESKPVRRITHAAAFALPGDVYRRLHIDPKKSIRTVVCRPTGSRPASHRRLKSIGFIKALAWFLVSDRLKLLAYRVFDPTAAPLLARKPVDLTPRITKRDYQLYEE